MARKTQLRRPLIIIVVCLLIGAVFLVFAPHFVRPRTDNLATNSCINNLRQLDGAAEQWRLENGFATNRCPAFEQLRVYLRRLPECPQGGSYSFDTNSGLPRCSFPGHVLR